MASNRQAELIAAIGQAVQAFQDATDSFDEAAAVRLGLHRTDLRCLAVVAQRQPIAVGEVGKAVNLTRGATTTALDRVESAGYTRRIRDPSDRRGVLIEMTKKGMAATEKIWGSMAAEGAAMLESFTISQLEAVQQFLEQGRAVQLRHIQAAPAKAKSRKPRIKKVTMAVPA